MNILSRARIAQIAAKLVARRPTSQDEVPELVRSVGEALARLAAPQLTVVGETRDVPASLAAPRVRRPRAETLAPLVEPAPPPPAPTLLRRADVVTTAAAADGGALLKAPAGGALRGVVKWFDQRTRRGALRLPGHGGDVPVEPALLDEMGITRLYKGQEVEAILTEGEAPRVMRLVLPGGTWSVNSTAGIVRSRQAKPVVVEMKREALRRVAARAEAEILLGPGRTR